MANTPLGPAIDAGAEEIYVVLLSQIGARKLTVPRNLLEGASLAFELAILASFKMALKQYEQDQIRQLIELGCEDAKQVLEGCV
jgi:hypothetical protein